MKNGSMSGRRLTAQTAITAPQATRTSVMGAVLCGSKKNRSHPLRSTSVAHGVRLFGVGHVRVVGAELVVRRPARPPSESGWAGRGRTETRATGDDRSSYSLAIHRAVGSHRIRRSSDRTR